MLPPITFTDPSSFCLPTKQKAQAIVDRLQSGKGYTQDVEGGNAGQGGYSVPPCRAEHWKLNAGDGTNILWRMSQDAHTSVKPKEVIQKSKKAQILQENNTIK